MNKNIAVVSSIVNTAAVFAFSVCMILKTNYGSYISSIFIAFSFIPMICAYCHYSSSDKKIAGLIAVAFSAIYGVFILAVYYAQLTAVIHDNLNQQASQIIDYSKYGLFFSYNLLGYGIMALSTFFAGLTINAASKLDQWLRLLLLIHGAFFFSCFIIPMLGWFGPDMQGVEWIGVAVLQFWCIYFAPIGVISAIHFRKKQYEYNAK